MQYKSNFFIGFFLIFLLCNISIIGALDKHLLVGYFCDYNVKRDSTTLEKIFKESWPVLVSDFEKCFYQPGNGFVMFQSCSNIPGTCGEGKILCIDGKTVGFVTYFMAQQNLKQYNKLIVKKGEGCIPLMAIDSNHRKKGYGTLAMLYMLSELKKQGCKTVKLSVNDKNIGAQNLYKKFLFSNTGKKSTQQKQKNSSSWWILKNLDSMNLNVHSSSHLNSNHSYL